MKKIPCDVYSRPCGYMSPVSRWNVGKQEEFHNRKMFDEDVSLQSRLSIEYDIIVFGAELCSGCQDLKQQLTEYGIKFNYYDAFKYQTKLNEYVDGDVSLPVLVYHGNVSTLDDVLKSILKKGDDK